MSQYQSLREKAVNGKKEDIDRLVEWLENNDTRAWNGECWDADGLRIFPVYEEDHEYEGQYNVVGYEMR